MKNLDFVKKNLGKWIAAVIILVVGVLCIVAGAQYNAINNGTISITDLNNVKDSISLILGISFIVVGGLGVALAFVVAFLTKRGFAMVASIAGIALTGGIWFVVQKTAFTLIEMFLSFVPYLILVLGCIMLVDAVLTLVFAILGKNIKASLPSMIVGFLTAAAAIVIGSLCMTKVITSGTQLMIFGILVICYSVFMIATTFVEIPKVSIVVEEKTKKTTK